MGASRPGSHRDDPKRTHLPMGGGSSRLCIAPESKRSRLWGENVHPPDFGMVDFDDLEAGTRTLYHMRGDWMYDDESTPAPENASGPVAEKGVSIYSRRGGFYGRIS